MDLEKLKEHFKGEILTGEKDLQTYSHDASVFEVRPQAVVKPSSVEDVKALVAFVAAAKQKDPGISITPRSAGTDMSGGAVGEGIIADFTTHFNRVLKLENSQVKPVPGHPHEDTCGQAVVEPGVFYRDFEKMSLEKGLLLPTYTASKSLNTVGGMVANNSAGEKTLSYGQTKDYVEEVKAVLADGNEYTFGPLTEAELEKKIKVPNFEGKLYRDIFHVIKENYELIQNAKPSTTKNSAGYLLWEVWNKRVFNMAKLLVGSQGTLGILTQATLNLVKPKPKSQLLVVFLKDLKPLGDVVHTIVQHEPESFESFDDHTFTLAMRFLPAMIKRMKGNVIKLGLQFLPELWMTLTGGIPKLILIAEFTGNTEGEIAGKIIAAQKEVKEKFGLKTHLTKSAEEAEKYWTVRRESFSLLRQHSSGLKTAPFIDDIAVHPKDLPEFLPRLNAILDKYPSLVYTIAGHAGDANFHIIPLMDLSKEDQRNIIPPLSHEVYDLVIEYKGTITAEHNDGIIRGPFLEKMYGTEVFGLFKKVKEIFDPAGIFNPHKKTDATEEYLLSHIRHD